MAPEQVRSSKSVDARADVWALAVTLHELLAGAPPFDGLTVIAILNQIERGSPRPLERPGVPAGLLALIRRCMSTDPAERPANAWAHSPPSLEPFGDGQAASASSRAHEASRRLRRGDDPRGDPAGASGPASAPAMPAPRRPRIGRDRRGCIREHGAGRDRRAGRERHGCPAPTAVALASRRRVCARGRPPRPRPRLQRRRGPSRRRVPPGRPMTASNRAGLLAALVLLTPRLAWSDPPATPPSEDQVEAGRDLYRQAKGASSATARRRRRSSGASRRTASRPSPVTAVLAAVAVARGGQAGGRPGGDCTRRREAWPLSPRETDKGREARQQAAGIAASLDARIPKIAVAGQPSGAQVLLDGKSLGAADSSAWRGVDPGTHALLVRIGDRTCTSVHLTLGEGEERTIDLHEVIRVLRRRRCFPAPAPAPAPAPRARARARALAPRARVRTRTTATPGASAASPSEPSGSSCGSASGPWSRSRPSTTTTRSRPSASCGGLQRKTASTRATTPAPAADIATGVIVGGAAAVVGGALMWWLAPRSAGAPSGRRTGHRRSRRACASPSDAWHAHCAQPRYAEPRRGIADERHVARVAGRTAVADVGLADDLTRSGSSRARHIPGAR